MTRIILIGYMGAGKTTIGKALAQELGVPFYDLDWYIETRMRRTIKQIPDEVRTFIVEQLAQREAFYSKANYTLNVDLLDNFTKIQTTIENLRKILER